MQKNKVFGLLGIAARGRNVVSGEFSTQSAVKDGSAILVLVAEDASENTKKLFRNKCTFYEVPIRFFGTKEELGHAIGKEQRSSLALLDEGLAKTVEKALDEGASQN